MTFMSNGNGGRNNHIYEKLDFYSLKTFTLSQLVFATKWKRWIKRLYSTGMFHRQYLVSYFVDNDCSLVRPYTVSE